MTLFEIAQSLTWTTNHKDLLLLYRIKEAYDKNDYEALGKLIAFKFEMK